MDIPVDLFVNFNNWVVIRVIFICSLVLSKDGQLEEDLQRQAIPGNALGQRHSFDQFHGEEVHLTDGIDILAVVNQRPPRPALDEPGQKGGGEEFVMVHRYTLGTMVQLWSKVRGRTIMVIGRLSQDQIPLTFESILRSG